MIAYGSLPFKEMFHFMMLMLEKFVWLALLVTIKVPVNAMVFCLIEILHVFSRVDI